MSAAGLCAFCLTQLSQKGPGKPISQRIRILHKRYTGPGRPIDAQSQRCCCDKRRGVLEAVAADEVAGSPDTRASEILHKQPILRQHNLEIDTLLGKSLQRTDLLHTDSVESWPLMGCPFCGKLSQEDCKHNKCTELCFLSSSRHR